MAARWGGGALMGGLSYWLSDAGFGQLRVCGLHKHNASASQSRAARSVDLGMVLGAALSMYDAKTTVCSALTGKHAKSLIMELEDLDSAHPINTYAVDSLLAVDIRAWDLKEAQSIIHVSDILKNVPMIKLAGTIAGKSKFLPDALREEGRH
ncbi:hypothetical protein DL771_008331 [Monosporascus sp. 5C6A]|nr:hypothetical protein DL771_008331 [Monosporascus sp. 5C6A]